MTVYLLSVDMMIFYVYILSVNSSMAVVIIILKTTYEDDLPCPTQCVDSGKDSQLVV